MDTLLLPDLDVTPVKLEDLPTNPKLWTPTQLSSYLTTALRVRSGEVMSLPLPVARDIAAFIKESKINGRLFLRLCEQDFDQSVFQIIRTLMSSSDVPSVEWE